MSTYLAYQDGKYAQGFGAGERAAFRDRRIGRTRVRPVQFRDTYERAWWDGYTPRSSTWARKTTPIGWWTGEVEDVPAVQFDATQIGAGA